MNRSILAKRVLRSEWRTQEQAAWELLKAVEALYPQTICNLVAVRKTLDVERLRQDFDARGVEGLEELEAQFAPLDEHVRKWANDNHLSCPAIVEAAARFVLGDSAPREVIMAVGWDEQTGPIEAPSITAKPHDETKEEFLVRASEHYDDVGRLFPDDAPSRVIQRDDLHFRYLAAHLVGGYRPTEIAAGSTPLNLPIRSQQAIDEGLRHAATLVGLKLRTERGRPRKHSRP